MGEYFKAELAYGFDYLVCKEALWQFSMKNTTSFPGSLLFTPQEAIVVGSGRKIQVSNIPARVLGSSLLENNMNFF